MNMIGEIMKNIDFLKKRIIAHRGIFDNKKVPENSIKAFDDAIKKDYPIELDIHLTKDNEIVVFHDDSLERMTNKTGSISSYTLKELKKIKLLESDYFIPSLDEVLSLVNGKVPLLIELKGKSKKNILEKELIKKLDNYNGKFAIQSFNPFFLRYFKKYKKEYLRGLLIPDRNYNYIKYKLAICYSKPDFLSVGKKLFNKKIVLKRDIPIFAWTINKKEEEDKYKDCFDNLICNIKYIA